MVPDVLLEGARVAPVGIWTCGFQLSTPSRFGSSVIISSQNQNVPPPSELEQQPPRWFVNPPFPLPKHLP